MIVRCWCWMLVLCTVVACSSELEDSIDQAIYGYDYFPLELGRYRVYEVDSLQYDLGASNLPVVDSSRFYIREEMVEVFTNQLGETIYRIERYRANTLGDPWQIVDVTTESRSVNQAYHGENNLRFINLVFPVETGLEWDGTAFIPEDLIIYVRGEAIEMFKSWSYKILSSGETETIGGFTYEEVATVQQADNDNAIEFRFGVEKYAKGIGLVYKERQIYDSYCKYIGQTEPCIGKAWHEIAGRGFLTRETLIDHN